MKQTNVQNEFLLPKRITLFFFAVLCLVFMQGIFVQAAEKTLKEETDYSVKAVEDTADSCKVVITPKNGISFNWIIVHFTNNTTQQQLNVEMTKDGNDWVYNVPSISHGESANLSFTYFITGGAAHDSTEFSYTIGTAFDEGGGNSGTGGNGDNDGDEGSGGDNDSDQDTPNLNSIRVEAEDYSSMSGVRKEASQISFLDANDWMRYSVPIEKAGSYRIHVYGKAEGASNGLLVFRDADKRITTVSLTNNGNYSDYQSQELSLPAGNLSLTVVVVSGGITADWIGFEPISPDYVDPGIETPPVEDPDIPEERDKMIFQFNNVTNGAYADSEIYWCALGYHPDSGELCYIDAKGNLIPATTDLNTIPLENNRWGAKIYNTLDENKYIYMPSITSGRLYISYGKPVYIEINKAADGRIGFAGPDMNNPSDPNANTLFEFMEFTIGLKGNVIEPVHYWGNTTRVDNFCFPVVTRLIGENRGYDPSGNVVSTIPYDKTVGDLGGRDYLRSEFVNNAPDAFKGLLDDQRVYAPCKKTFNKGEVNGNFFDETIAAFWTKYANEDFKLTCQGGEFTARVVDNRLTFTESRSNSTGYIDKPTTQDVLEGKGAFDRRSQAGVPGDLELVLEAQLCAAFNRGLALRPTSEWYDTDKYYLDENYPYNYYSKFWHMHCIGGLSYGFCYDDVNDQSTLLECNTAKKLIIDLKWN